MSLLTTEHHRNQEAEDAILGAMLFQPENIAKISEGLRESEFYHAGNRCIFRHLLVASAEGVNIELQTFAARLSQAGDLEKVGGAANIFHLHNLFISHSAALQCRTLVKEAWLRREASRIMMDAISEGQTRPDVQGWLADTAEAIQSIGADSDHHGGHRNMRELVGAAIERYEEASKSHGKLRGISTGFLLLDQFTGGYCPGHLWVLGGGTSDGKSAAVEQSILAVGSANVPCAIYTLEMSADENVDRFFGQDAQIPSESFMRGTFTHEEGRAFSKSAMRLMELPIHIRDVSGIKKTELLADMRLLWRIHKIKVFAIDYGQLIASEGKHFSREREVADLSASMKAFAKETKSTVIFVSALNEEGKLRESRALGYDADKVCRVRVPFKEGSETELDDTQRVFHIDKNRGGQRFKKIAYDFDGSTFRFLNEREMVKPKTEDKKTTFRKTRNYHPD